MALTLNICKTRVRDSSGKPAGRHDRGLVADSPTRLIMLEGKLHFKWNCEIFCLLKVT